MSVRIVHHNNIDFLKFVFLISIICFHCIRSSWGEPILETFPGFIRGNVCVDFFFIIGGFFLFSLLNKDEDTFSFAKKKFFRLAPMLWVAISLLYILSLFFPEKLNFLVVNNLMRCLLITNIGVTAEEGMISSIPWFVCVYFWVSIFYFYIGKIVNKKNLNLIIALIVYIGFCLYFSVREGGTGGVSKACYGFINLGVLRGLIGFGIGYILAMIYNSKFLFKVSSVGKIIISFIEILIVYFLINHLVFTDDMPLSSLFIFSFLFAVLFYCFLIKKGIISGLLENKYLGYLGRYSYSMYMLHWVILKFFKLVVYDNHVKYYNHHQLTIVLYIILVTIVLSVFAYHLIEKPVYKYLRNKYCTKLVSDKKVND